MQRREGRIKAFTTIRRDARAILDSIRESACQSNEEREVFDLCAVIVYDHAVSMESITLRHQIGEDLFTSILGDVVYCLGYKLTWMSRDLSHGQALRGRFAVAAKTVAPVVARLEEVLRERVVPPAPAEPEDDETTLSLESQGWVDPWVLAA